MLKVTLLIVVIFVAIIQAQTFAVLQPGKTLESTIASTGSAYYIKIEEKGISKPKYVKPLFEACTGSVVVYVKYCTAVNCIDSENVPTPSSFDFFANNTASVYDRICTNENGKCENGVVYYIALVAKEDNTKISAALQTFTKDQYGYYGYRQLSTRIDLLDFDKTASVTKISWCDNFNCRLESFPEVLYKAYIQIKGESNYNMGSACGATQAKSASASSIDGKIALTIKPEDGEFTYNVIATFAKYGESYSIPYTPTRVVKSHSGGEPEYLFFILIGVAAAAFLIVIAVIAVVVVVIARKRRDPGYEQMKY